MGPSNDSIAGELIAHAIKGEDFWSIATVRTKDQGPVTVVGKLLGASLGDYIEVEGSWHDHPTFGRQFRCVASTVKMPQTDHGVVLWMTSTLPGIGETRARAVLEHFGGVEALWDVIETSPDRLAEVKGISESGAKSIVDAYFRCLEDRDRMIKFRSYGMTENQIARMIAVWADEAEARLQANPYELAKVVDGFGFLRADAIAQRMGVDLECEARIECGLVHTMEQATGHGHCFISSGKLVKIAATQALRVDSSIVAKVLKKMRKSGTFTVHGARVYEKQIDLYEQRCADGVRRLLAERKG